MNHVTPLPEFMIWLHGWTDRFIVQGWEALPTSSGAVPSTLYAKSMGFALKMKTLTC